MRIGDVKNRVLATLNIRREYLLGQKYLVTNDAKQLLSRIKEINEELEGIRQTERLINTASNRGE